MVKANEVTQGSKGKLIKPGDRSSIPEIPMKAEGENKLYDAVLWPPHMDYGMALPPDITHNDDAMMMKTMKGKQNTFFLHTVS